MAAVAILGGGVVGLSCFRLLSAAGLSPFLFEREAVLGSGNSSRSSEVLHAGLYYEQESLKAKLCVRGRELFESFLIAHQVPHRIIGKLVVATTDEDVPKLAQLEHNALANGVTGVRLLNGDEAQKMEPEISCKGALLSIRTGILDSHAAMQAMEGEGESYGGEIVLRSEVVKGRLRKEGGCLLSIRSHDGLVEDIECQAVINSTGLFAPDTARALGLPSTSIPKHRFAKGNYFSLAAARETQIFNKLIYPLPQSGGLGVHLTLDLAGNLRFGPDVQWVTEEDRADFSVDSERAKSFHNEIRKYWPNCPGLESLAPAYAGIRPKVESSDFHVQGSRQHGIKGLVNLFGIESPGITSSLALAERVGEVLVHDEILSSSQLEKAKEVLM